MNRHHMSEMTVVVMACMDNARLTCERSLETHSDYDIR